MLKTSAEGVQKVRHENIAKMLHWKLCEKWSFSNGKKWYINKPEKFQNLRTARSCGISLYRLTRPLNIIDQMTVIDKKSKKCIMIDPACPFDTHIEK